MPKFIVTKDFADLLDGGYVYRKGDVYPREGHTPKDDRINELSSESNKRKEILIATTDEHPDELENFSVEAIRQYTNDDIKARLDKLGFDYKSSDTKDKLIERLLKRDGDQ